MKKCRKFYSRPFRPWDQIFIERHYNFLYRMKIMNLFSRWRRYSSLHCGLQCLDTQIDRHLKYFTFGIQCRNLSLSIHVYKQITNLTNFFIFIFLNVGNVQVRAHGHWWWFSPLRLCTIYVVIYNFFIGRI